MSNIEEILKEWWKAPSRENTLSSMTYDLIKIDLEKYFWNSVDVFLQGSYANATNIKQDSDIDVVLCYKDTYYYNIDNLSESQKNIFESSLSWRWKDFFELKKAVLNFLKSKYSNNLVERKNKCINISKWWNIKVNVDVVPCFEYRMYKSYWYFNTTDYYSWTKFLSDNNEGIINFQKIHQKKGEYKNQNTNENYKKVVRILKNAQKYLIDKWELLNKILSSFTIENIVYNISNSLFIKNNSLDVLTKEILRTLYNDMDIYEKYYFYEEVCELFWLLRWSRIKENPKDIKNFCEKIWNLLN